MRVLLSVKPEYAESILNGTKRFEFRKSVFRREGIKTVVLYSTMPVGKVVGEFDIATVHSAQPPHLWRLTSHAAGISRTFFDAYFSGRHTAHAIEVKQTRRYRWPKRLSSLTGVTSAPQSYRYL